MSSSCSTSFMDGRFQEVSCMLHWCCVIFQCFGRFFVRVGFCTVFSVGKCPCLVLGIRSSVCFCVCLFFWASFFSLLHSKYCQSSTVCFSHCWYCVELHPLWFRSGYLLRVCHIVSEFSNSELFGITYFQFFSKFVFKWMFPEFKKGAFIFVFLDLMCIFTGASSSLWSLSHSAPCKVLTLCRLDFHFIWLYKYTVYLISV